MALSKKCPSCDEPISANTLACRRCWFDLPDELRFAWGRARKTAEKRIAARKILAYLKRGE